MLGATALQAGRTREAERHLRACLHSPRTEQLRASASLALARCHFQRGDYRKCREACLGILRDEPATPRADEVLFLLGEASERAGLTSEGERYYRRLIEAFPSSPFAHRAKARLGEGPSGLPRASPGGRYDVQVTALVSATNAAEHAKLFRQRGYPARVVKTRGRWGELHAVRVGPYATKADAQRVAARLRAEGFKVLIKP